MSAERLPLRSIPVPPELLGVTGIIVGPHPILPGMELSGVTVVGVEGFPASTTYGTLKPGEPIIFGGKKIPTSLLTTKE